MKNKLFPDVPEDISGLSAEEIQGHIAALRARVAEVKSRDPEVVGDLTITEVLDQVTAAVAQIETLAETLSTREAASADFDTALEQLAAKAGVEDAPVEPVVEETPVEPVAVAEPVVEPVIEEVVVEEIAPEPVLVAAARPALPTPTPAHEPVIEAPVDLRTAFVAAAGIPGLGEQSDLNDKKKLAGAMIAKRYQGTSVAAGIEEKVLVASAQYGHMFPEDRRLYGRADDAGKIENVIGETALLASGGLCAPVSNYYELMNIAVADRPVRDAMANFNAVRGGLKFAAPPKLSAVTGVGIKTAAQDALGGTYATKSCQVVSCPSFSEVDLSMIYHCVQFGNLNSRAFPEQVAQFNELVLAAHARLAEQALLDYIKSTATNVTSTAIYGAYSTLVNDILFAGAGLRSRNRMAVGSKLRVGMPEWVGDLIAADLTNRAFSDFQYTRDNVAALLEKQDVLVSWYMDTATGEGQVFGTQSTGALLRFPTTVKWYIYPEGSYLFLDGGTLDLGIVRDSTLNSTNDFQIFGETFEAAAFVGTEALYVTSTVCPDGTTGPTATAITCS